MADLRLVPLQPGGAALEPSGDRATLGRAHPADLVVDESAVSRNHAVLERHSAGWRIVDQGSANGTFVDGQRVNWADLRDGQELRVGARAFRVELTAAVPATTILPAVQAPAPPRLRAEPAASPGPGLWRDGRVLVMLKIASLPARCVRCGDPAQARLRRKLAWHHPALGLLILVGVLLYVIVVAVVRKTATVDVPICAHHKSRRMVFGILGTLAVLLGLAVGLGTLLARGHWLFLYVAFAIFVAGLVMASLGSRLVTPRRIDDHFVWLSGAHESLLAGLPAWPGPTRALTGLAVVSLPSTG